MHDGALTSMLPCVHGKSPADAGEYEEVVSGQAAPVQAAPVQAAPLLNAPLLEDGEDTNNAPSEKGAATGAPH